MSILEMFNKYIYTETEKYFQVIPTVDVISNKKPDELLSTNEIINDFEAFKSIILYAYAGRQHWEIVNNIKFIDIFTELEKSVLTSGDKSINWFTDFICESIKQYIHDNHFWIGKNWFGRHKDAYFTDIVLEKTQDIKQYKVIKSNITKIVEGDYISCSDENLFPTLSPTGRYYYIVGCLRWDVPESITVSRNGTDISLPLHRCRTSEINKDIKAYFDQTQRDGIEVIRSGCYNHHSDYTYEAAEELGHKLKDSNQIVWDLTSNPGGSDLYPGSFIQGLNGYSEHGWSIAVLHSNYTDNDYSKEPFYFWTYKEAQAYDLSKSSYNKPLYLLVNSLTASAGEIAIAYSRSVPNPVIIGENTMGCGNFGQVEKYILPNSGIKLHIPCRIFQTGFAEGVGYMPDYWVDSSELQSEVIRWLKEGADYIPHI